MLSIFISYEDNNKRNDNNGKKELHFKRNSFSIIVLPFELTFNNKNM